MKHKWAYLVFGHKFLQPWGPLVALYPLVWAELLAWAELGWALWIHHTIYAVLPTSFMAWSWRQHTVACLCLIRICWLHIIIHICAKQCDFSIINVVHVHVFCDLMPCNLPESYQHLGGSYSLNLGNGKVSNAEKSGYTYRKRRKRNTAASRPNLRLGKWHKKNIFSSKHSFSLSFPSNVCPYPFRGHHLQQPCFLSSYLYICTIILPHILIFNPENGCSMFLLNISNFLLDYISSYTRRQYHLRLCGCKLQC